MGSSEQTTIYSNVYPEILVLFEIEDKKEKRKKENKQKGIYVRNIRLDIIHESRFMTCKKYIF